MGRSNGSNVSITADHGINVWAKKDPMNKTDGIFTQLIFGLLEVLFLENSIRLNYRQQRTVARSASAKFVEC